MSEVLSELQGRDAILAAHKNTYGSFTGTVDNTRGSIANNGPYLMFTVTDVTCRVGGKRFQFDHCRFAIFAWQTHLDDSIVKPGAKIEVYGLIERYIRRSDDTLGYGVKRIGTLRRAN